MSTRANVRGQQCRSKDRRPSVARRLLHHLVHSGTAGHGKGTVNEDRSVLRPACAGNDMLAARAGRGSSFFRLRRLVVKRARHEFHHYRPQDVSELPSFTMPTCFVPGCTSGYKSNLEKRHFFAPPSDPQLLERHVIDGQVVEIDRGCWALQPDAVPCQFPNVPSYLSRTIKRRRSPKERASLPNKVVLVTTPSVECQQEVPDPVHNIDFAEIVENGSSLKLPKNWRMGDLEEDTGKPRQVVFYNAGMKDDVYAILKSVAIHEDLTAQCKMQHPCLPSGAYLHFICDVPHVIKCVRNHLVKHKYGQIGDHKLNYNHYEQLYDAEKKVEIKVVPKLTEYHIKPQKLQAMNVRLATQLFSRSVAIGFKVYRELNVPGFDDTAGTEKVTSLLNDLFDILNAKIPQAGIRKGSPKIKFLEEFLDMLNQTEARKDVKLIASNQTVESLRVTLMSVLCIIEFLHSEGVSYILTAKLNQDPLERFFGLVRSLGGDEDHPTVTKFSQLFRLLSLYTPVKVAVKGNCERGSDRVLLSAFESLGEKRREALVRKSAMKDKVWQQLMSIPFHDLSRVPDDHGSNVPSPEATALYYLAGYVAFKLKKTTRCEVCKEDALGRRDSLPKEALLVIEREYDVAMFE
ncbi:hypothetical protein HPB50_019605 [Hyalomma asiaticum]|uniref:Uncharacterized protein n=1 Tax=Hyalomma asiaticum TaxID=266040 RepID=A0ACB7RRY0_HYAAI|nr:hypothetical protein HPB50_019605 [Hyalomma asiaticum]